MSHDEMLRERLARLAQGVDAEIEPALARALRAGKGRRRRAVVLNAVVGAGMVAAAVLGVVRVVTQPEAARFDAPRDSKKGQPFFLDCGGLDVGAIYPPAVSADGRVLAFVSTLGKDRNPDPAKGIVAIYVCEEGATKPDVIELGPLPRRATGVPGIPNTHGPPSLSGDGRLIAWDSFADDPYEPGKLISDIFFMDRRTRKVTRVTKGKGDSVRPVFSADGRFIAFESDASDLVPDDTNRDRDVFRYRVGAGKLEHVSIYQGVQALGPSGGATISADGRYVAFASAHGRNPSRILLRDMARGRLEVLCPRPRGLREPTRPVERCLAPTISPDGEVVAFLRTDYRGTGGTHLGELLISDRRGALLGQAKSILVQVGDHAIEARAPSFAPDGRTITFMRSPTSVAAFRPRNGAVESAGGTVLLPERIGRYEANYSTATPLGSRYIALYQGSSPSWPARIRGDVYIYDLEKRRLHSPTGQPATNRGWPWTVLGVWIVASSLAAGTAIFRTPWPYAVRWIFGVVMIFGGLVLGGSLIGGPVRIVVWIAWLLVYGRWFFGHRGTSGGAASSPPQA